MFEEKREAVMAIEAVVLPDGSALGFLESSASLPIPLSLMIEFLISALRFSGFLPKFIGSANNFYPGGPFHYGFSLYP